MKTITFAAAIIAAAIGNTAVAQTNGYILQCLSARASGQGCVTRARTDLPTSLFRDPAGLVAYTQPQLEINVAPFVPSLRFHNSAQDGVVDGAVHAYPMASFAYVGRPLAGKVAWAVGMEPLGGFGSDFTLHHALLSGGPNGPHIDYESFFAAVKFGPSFAYALTPRLSVGASVSGVYAQIREFRMPFTIPPSVARGMAGIPQLDPQVYNPLFAQFTEMTAYGDSKSYSGLTWSADAGIAYRAPSGFAFSASWTPERTVEVKNGLATIDMSAQFGQMLHAMVMARAQAYNENPAAAQQAVMQQLAAAGLNLQAGVIGHYDAATEITLPMTVGAGVSVPLARAWKLGAEIEWRQWSKAATMPFILTNGDNANINMLMNGDPTNANFFYPFPLEWEDATSAKVGLEYALTTDNALRAGFMTGKNPVPTHTVFITFPAISTKAATVGATFKFAGVPIDFSYVHAFDEEITGTSQAHKLGNEYVNSVTTMQENVFTIGTILKF